MVRLKKTRYQRWIQTEFLSKFRVGIGRSCNSQILKDYSKNSSENAINCQPMEATLKLLPLFWLFHLALLLSAFYRIFWFNPIAKSISDPTKFYSIHKTDWAREKIHSTWNSQLITWTLQFTNISVRGHAISYSISRLKCSMYYNMHTHSPAIHKGHTNLFC